MFYYSENELNCTREPALRRFHPYIKEVVNPCFRFFFRRLVVVNEVRQRTKLEIISESIIYHKKNEHQEKYCFLLQFI